MPIPPLDLDAIQARADAATPGPWRATDDDDTWRMHGTHPRIPGMKWQILKAPKANTPYAEYWPSPADAEFIVQARQDVPALLARVQELETELHRERAAHSSTIDERDRAAHYADRLAAALAPIDVRGEHSIGNCPWMAALNYADESTPDGGPQ
ncbi:hypothetical protein [Kitasatospora sp. NPDC058046]|uniref:hypothetical protein n=1 Tax=Kitasatospora sp. NPDC058046 TaxID=3346312 RepID=UPI0036DA47BB